MNDLPYFDTTRDLDSRLDDLMGRLSIPDKVGMMFQTLAAVLPIDQPAMFGPVTVQDMIVERRMRHFNVVGAAQSARAFAEWHNEAQRVALAADVPVPITFSTDPRHGLIDNPLTATSSGVFSRWPEMTGLAAIGDEEVVFQFADIARQEYCAVGIRLALHPQIDLATEPRWSRIVGTFGEDADLTSRLVRAYVRGFQGETLGHESVSTVTKHFPGVVRRKDGMDPHFPNGREQVYPGGQWDYHMAPFLAAIEVGTAQIMPYYGMPVATEYEAVGFSFNREIVTTLLRETLGFDGILLTDWGLVTDLPGWPARAWGVEHLSEKERMLRILDAGCDQFGGEMRTDLLLEMVTSGEVSEGRLDRSVRRLLREKFVLGLFDAPFVDVDRAEEIAGCAEFVEAGEAAQRASVTVLSNGGEGNPTLPLRRGMSVYLEGMDPAVVSPYATVVDDPAQADVAIVRLEAPFEPKDGWEGMFHGGSLEFEDLVAAHVQDLIAQVPTVVDVFLERPVVLTPFADAAALIGTFGTSDAQFARVLFEGGAKGRLPFDLPRSMAAVVASRSDMPFDTEDPLFRFGDGMAV